jgi:hypothetical protein
MPGWDPSGGATKVFIIGDPHGNSKGIVNAFRQAPGSRLSWKDWPYLVDKVEVPGVGQFICTELPGNTDQRDALVKVIKRCLQGRGDVKLVFVIRSHQDNMLGMMGMDLMSSMKDLHIAHDVVTACDANGISMAGTYELMFEVDDEGPRAQQVMHRALKEVPLGSFRPSDLSCIQRVDCESRRAATKAVAELCAHGKGLPCLRLRQQGADSNEQEELVKMIKRLLD